MSPTVIRDTTIVTVDPGKRVLYNAAIAIGDDGRIADLGPTSQIAAAYTGADTIDGRGKAVFPGFFNCHTHLTATLSRGIQEDFAFPTTLRFPRPVNSFLSTEELQVMATLGAIEGIRSGTTTFFELGGDVSSYIEPVIATGARLVLGEMVRDVDYNVIISGSPLRSSADFTDSLGDEGFTKAVDLFEKYHESNDGRGNGLLLADDGGFRLATGASTLERAGGGTGRRVHHPPLAEPPRGCGRFGRVGGASGALPERARLPGSLASSPPTADTWTSQRCG